MVKTIKGFIKWEVLRIHWFRDLGHFKLDYEAWIRLATIDFVAYHPLNLHSRLADRNVSHVCSPIGVTTCSLPLNKTLGIHAALSMLASLIH